MQATASRLLFSYNMSSHDMWYTLSLTLVTWLLGLLYIDRLMSATSFRQ